MKRLMWGILLFSVVTATVPWQLQACDEKKSPMPSFMEASSTVTHVGENTVVISTDEEFVTVTVYENAGSNWM